MSDAEKEHEKSARTAVTYSSLSMLGEDSLAVTASIIQCWKVSLK